MGIRRWLSTTQNDKPEQGHSLTVMLESCSGFRETKGGREARLGRVKLARLDRCSAYAARHPLRRRYTTSKSMALP